MKKVLMMVLTVLISVAFVTVVFAQAPAGTSEKKTTTTTTTPEKKETTTTTPEKKETTTTTPEKKETTTTTETTKGKGKRHEYRGEVVSMDAAAKTLVVKGKKGDMTFDVSSAKMKGYKSMDGMKAGDKVGVKFVEKDGTKVATAIWKSSGKRAHMPKSSEKPTDTVPTPAPAK